MPFPFEIDEFSLLCSEHFGVDAEDVRDSITSIDDRGKLTLYTGETNGPVDRRCFLLSMLIAASCQGDFDAWARRPVDDRLHEVQIPAPTATDRSIVEIVERERDRILEAQRRAPMTLITVDSASLNGRDPDDAVRELIGDDRFATLVVLSRSSRQSRTSDADTRACRAAAVAAAGSMANRRVVFVAEDVELGAQLWGFIRGTTERRRAVGALFTDGAAIDRFNKADFEPFILEQAFTEAEASR